MTLDIWLYYAGNCSCCLFALTGISSVLRILQPFFWDVTQRSPKDCCSVVRGALRDVPENGCGGD